MTAEIYALECGQLTMPLKIFFEEAGEGVMRAPIPSFLVKHAKGSLLFDTGLNEITRVDPKGYLGERLAGLMEVHFGPGEDLQSRLQRIDVEISRVDYVVNSHLHFDHCNNVDLFPHAKILVSANELTYVDAPHNEDLYIPWMIMEQLKKHDVTLIDGEHEITKGVSYFPAPGHTPGSFGVQLDTEEDGCVVLAGDSLKYPKEAITGECDMAFGTAESGTNTISRILKTADRIVPGHFPELVKQNGRFTWKDTAELSLVIR